MSKVFPSHNGRSEFESNSFAKGLRILEAFEGDTALLSMADIARRAGQDRATARRGILTLEAMGFLRRHGRLFSLTPKVLKLSESFLQSSRVPQDVWPILNQCATRLKADVCLATLIDTRVLLICTAVFPYSSTAMRNSAGPGFAPLSSALGQMLLAQQPQEISQTLMDQIAQTEPVDTITTPELSRHIQTARTAGFAFDDGACRFGYANLAVPVQTSTDQALVVGLLYKPSQPLSETIETCVDLLHDCAADLSSLTNLSLM
ncbi:helix-turn-helix domain-containing protein [Epibacterium sp. SM1979]|uniref:Helix-turn-helix domain-containing protein n=1 Tax=Tritonibacter litoralis TaxID=2662264 RepID=A0A843YD54_9RHOB|nr:helix-turn-helix domain-containing protein [Tritonibacter litoralis]MQQ09290.1 helix-turn-helix domain-containing protein [Tritonibacter litoralis]